MLDEKTYQPDDAQVTVAALEYLRNTSAGLKLRQTIAGLPKAGIQPTVSQIAALRKEFPAQAIHAALILAKLQPKGAGPGGKFPDLAYVWATPEALEQATHRDVGRYKASIYAACNAGHIFDLCAGIGGDTLALAHIAPVTAVDLSPVRTICLRFNYLDSPRGSPVAPPIHLKTEDIRPLIQHIPMDAWVHIDPARRSAGKRSPRYEDLLPGPEVLEQLIARVKGGAIKLSPAVDFDTLPPGHLELISHHGTVVQALLWFGAAARQPSDHRTATVLSRRPVWSITALPRAVVLGAWPSHDAPGSNPVFLYEVDGAVTRAGLAQVVADTFHLTLLTSDGGYLLSEAGAPMLIEPALTPFRVQVIVPFARVVGTLRKLIPPLPAAPGPVEVKARGHLPGIDTDQLQREWSQAQGCAYTVLLFRQEKETLAAIAFRAAASEIKR
jgi:hypothetical protein